VPSGAGSRFLASLGMTKGGLGITKGRVLGMTKGRVMPGMATRRVVLGMTKESVTGRGRVLMCSALSSELASGWRKFMFTTRSRPNIR